MSISNLLLSQSLSLSPPSPPPTVYRKNHHRWNMDFCRSFCKVKGLWSYDALILRIASHFLEKILLNASRASSSAPKKYDNVLDCSSGIPVPPVGYFSDTSVPYTDLPCFQALVLPGLSAAGNLCVSDQGNLLLPSWTPSSSSALLRAVRYRNGCKDSLLLHDVIGISQSWPCPAQRSCYQWAPSKHFFLLHSFGHATWHLDTLPNWWAEPPEWTQVYDSYQQSAFHLSVTKALIPCLMTLILLGLYFIAA